jgi:hypothetical protein
MTKEERSEYNRQYRLKNLERINEKQKIHRSKNRKAINAKAKEYSIKNQDKKKEYLKEYRKANKAEIKEYNASYRKNNKDKIKSLICDWSRKQYKTPIYRIKSAVKTQIHRWLKVVNGHKNKRTHEILGCNYEEFKQHLESQFLPWMNWDNYGKHNSTFNYGWDIDHIEPLSSATCEEDVIRLNHYTNLQPLCSHINRDIKRNNPLN